jgi:hypothetical protein
MLRAFHCVTFLVLAVPWAAALAPATTREDAPARELARDAEQEAALLKVAGNGFRIQRTPHFLIAHNVANSEVKPFVARVEQVYLSIYRFCAFNKIPAVEPRRRLEIIFFNTFPEYERYARRDHFPAAGTYGFYYDEDNRTAFYNVANDIELVRLRRDLHDAERTVASMEKQITKAPAAAARITLRYNDGTSRTLTREQARNEFDVTCARLKKLSAHSDNYVETINRTVVQHETTHQVFFNAGVLRRGGQNPAWLIEGLATLFETPPSGTGSGIGVVNQLRLKDFRAAVGADVSRRGVTPEAVLAATRKGPLVPLDKLLTNPSLFDTRGERGAIYYAEAWALIHYLHRTKAKEFAEYLKLIAARPPDRPVTSAAEIADFERVFGKIDDMFVRRWGRYILSLPTPSQ